METSIQAPHAIPCKRKRRFLSTFASVFLLTVASSYAIYEAPVPRVAVRWSERVARSQRDRGVLEATYHLAVPDYEGERTWSYGILDTSIDNIRRIVQDPAVEDTHKIDRATLTLAGPLPTPLFLRARFWFLSSFVGIVVASFMTWMGPALRTRRRHRAGDATEDSRQSTATKAGAAPLVKSMVVVGSLLFAFALGELLVRIYENYADLQANNTERFLDYGDIYRQGGLGPGGFLKENFNNYVTDGYGNSVWWENNSQGFRNSKEFERAGDDNVLRVLSLGDSFTAGYRVGQTETFSALLEEWSTERITPTEVLVSCIEAPSIGLTYLRESGIQWQPDLVLLGVTIGNDITQDYVSRDSSITGFSGEFGLEGYDLPDYTLSDKTRGLKAGLAALLRTYSRTFAMISEFTSNKGDAVGAWYGKTPKPKMFDASHGLGFFIKAPPQPITDALNRHIEVLADFRDYLEPRNVKFAALLFPQRFQVQSEDWTETVRSYSLDESAFDLMYPNRAIMNFCVESGIECIDATGEMQSKHEETGINFYYPRGDMHWNREGHKHWLEGAKPELEKIILGASQGSRRVGGRS